MSAPKPKQGKKLKPKSKEETTIIEDEEDFDDENLLDDDDLDDMENDVFWSLTVDPNDSDCIIEEPTIPGYLVHVTSASFGDQVNKNSRTILYCLSLGQKAPTPICVLTEGTHESQSLDLMFGASAKFSLKGRNMSTVYLTGYLQPPQPEDFLNDDDEFGDEDIDDLPRKRGFQDEKEEVEDEELKPQPKKKGKQKKQEPPTKKQKFETVHEEKHAEKTSEIDKKETQNEDKSKTNDTSPQKSTEAATPTATKTETKLSKRQQKKAKLAQKQAQQAEQQQNKEVTEKNDTSNATDSTPNKTETVKTDVKQAETPKTNDSTEVTHKDLKVGPGPAIKQGQTLLVHYVGQTQDDEIFDKHITGDGFEFKYGSDEVIKGWTLGMKGMKVGGKRRIIVPPQLAYGEKGAGKIPPNATLKFTIEVKSAK